MKKFRFISAILALALVLGLALVSCDNGTGSTGESGNSGYRQASNKIYYLQSGEWVHSATTYYKYRSDGFFEKMESFGTDGTPGTSVTYYYNSYGWLIRIESDYISSYIVQEIEYEFGENLVREIYSSTTPTGTTISISEVTYSGDRPVESKTYRSDGTLTSIVTYFYDNSGRLTQYTREGSGATQVSTYSYNSFGRLEFILTSYDGVLMQRNEYTYERGISRSGTPRPDGTVP